MSEPALSAIVEVPVATGPLEPVCHVAVSAEICTPETKVAGLAREPVIVDVMVPVALETVPLRSTVASPMLSRSSALTLAVKTPSVVEEPLTVTVPVPFVAVAPIVITVAVLAVFGAIDSDEVPLQPLGRVRKGKPATLRLPESWPVLPLAPVNATVNGSAPIEVAGSPHEDGVVTVPDVIEMKAGETEPLAFVTVTPPNVKDVFENEAVLLDWRLAEAPLQLVEELVSDLNVTDAPVPSDTTAGAEPADFLRMLQ